MAPTEMLARDFTFELNTGTVGSPTWVEIDGINTWSHSPEANDADTTKFSNAGRMSHMKASRGDEFSLSGFAQEDPDDGSEDPGQAACKAWSKLVGPSSVKQFRITSPADNTLTFEATSTLTLGGGGNDDPNAWECTVKVTGDITDSNSASVPGAPGSPAGTGLNDSMTLTWTAGTGTTAGYEVRVYTASGDTLTETVYTSDLSAFITGLANTTAYYFKVRGFNAAGYGSYSSDSADITTS